jgi:hypothetical protein
MILGPMILHPVHFLNQAQLAKNPFATIFFRNDLVTDCFYRDSLSNHDIETFDQMCSFRAQFFFFFFYY